MKKSYQNNFVSKIIDTVVNHHDLCDETPSVSEWSGYDDFSENDVNSDHIKIELANRECQNSIQFVLAEKRFIMLIIETAVNDLTYIMQEDGQYWQKNGNICALYDISGEMVDLVRS